MPIIFAQAIMFVPGLIGGVQLGMKETAAGQWMQAKFQRYVWTSGIILAFALLIIVFTYFYTAITVPTNKMADDLKTKRWFYTRYYDLEEKLQNILDKIMSQITLPGSVFLSTHSNVFPAYCGKVHRSTTGMGIVLWRNITTNYGRE